MLKSFFVNKDAEIFVANTIAEGLASIEKHEPDILFLDNNLPDGLGWSLISTILNRLPSIEINLISAYKNGDFIISSNNALKFWEKPINLDELSKCV